MRIVISYESDADNPLTEDNEAWCVTYLKRSRYLLGNCPSSDSEIARFADRADYISRPVYTYIHRSTVMSVGHSWYGRLPQGHAEFDSGLSGYISISKDNIRELYGVKRITRKVLERVYDDMQSVLDRFCAYLNGDVYYMALETYDGDAYDCITAYGDDERDSILADWVEAYPDAEVNYEDR